MKSMQALSATGLRAIRYAREVEGLGQVVALDNDKGWSWNIFVICMRRNSTPRPGCIDVWFDIN